jgi:hypothetical protein
MSTPNLVFPDPLGPISTTGLMPSRVIFSASFNGMLLSVIFTKPFVSLSGFPYYNIASGQRLALDARIARHGE